MRMYMYVYVYVHVQLACILTHTPLPFPFSISLALSLSRSRSHSLTLALSRALSPSRSLFVLAATQEDAPAAHVRDTGILEYLYTCGMSLFLMCPCSLCVIVPYVSLFLMCPCSLCPGHWHLAVPIYMRYILNSCQSNDTQSSIRPLHCITEF